MQALGLPHAQIYIFWYVCMYYISVAH